MADNGKEVYSTPEKESYSDPNAVHNEKMALEGGDSDLASNGGRRQSVAGTLLHAYPRAPPLRMRKLSPRPLACQSTRRCLAVPL
jgi:hypothetical protein